MGISFNFSVTEKGSKAPGWSIESDKQGEWTFQDLLDFTKRSLIMISKEALDEELAKGFDRGFLTRVDNSLTKPVIAVSPLGKIEFVARAEIKDLLLEVYSDILNRSRIGQTWQYISSHFVFYNNKEVARNWKDLNAWLATDPTVERGDVIRIVNLMPYARKLERRGITQQRKRARWVKSRDPQKRSGDLVETPNGAYFLAQRAAARKYKSNVFLRFEFLPGGRIPDLSSIPAKSKTGRDLRRTYSPRGRWHKSGAYLYPSIKIGIGQGTK